jgi:hypothetical protein
VSQFDEIVIPGEQNDIERDPESRKMVENQIILDPGSRPASVFAKASPDRPRDLAGMTNYDTAFQGEGCLDKFQMPCVSTRRVSLPREIQIQSGPFEFSLSFLRVRRDGL